MRLRIYNAPTEPGQRPYRSFRFYTALDALMAGYPDAFEERVNGQFKEHVFARGRCEVWPGVYAELLGSERRSEAWKG